MSATFTPGPWDCTGCMFPDDDLGGVYYRVQADGIDARGANARLIAAAPELYEALDRLLAVAEMTTFSDQYPRECEQAHATLAKARGES